MLLLPSCSPERVTPSEVTFRSGESVTSAPREVEFPSGTSVVVEVAADPESRAEGLMFRPSLSEDRGMLFLFPAKGLHSFWMKNTLISLDIIWVDESRAIVHIEEDVPPCQADPCPSYSPVAKAVAVLELAAGQVAKRGLRIGDVLGYRGGIENIAAR